MSGTNESNELVQSNPVIAVLPPGQSIDTGGVAMSGPIAARLRSSTPRCARGHSVDERELRRSVTFLEQERPNPKGGPSQQAPHKAHAERPAQPLPRGQPQQRVQVRDYWDPRDGAVRPTGQGQREGQDFRDYRTDLDDQASRDGRRVRSKQENPIDVGRLPINKPAYATVDQLDTILNHIQRLEASNRDLQRQVRTPSPTSSYMSRETSPIRPRLPCGDPSPYIPPPQNRCELISKKPPPPSTFNFPPVLSTMDQQLRHRTEYIVLQDLVMDPFIPDGGKRKLLNDTPTTRYTVSDLSTWQDAFSVFALYRGYYHPDMALAFVAYGGIIRGLASRKQDFRFWTEYDQRFRQKMALSDVSFASWFHEDTDIVKAVKNNMKIATKPVPRYVTDWKTEAICNICRVKGHISPQCPDKDNFPRTSASTMSPAAVLNHVLIENPTFVPRVSKSDITSSLVPISKPSADVIDTTPMSSDLIDIPLKAYTPLKPDRFQHMLQNYPDPEFVNYFVNGLRNGFRLGYDGPRFARSTENARTARDFPHVVREYVKKEVASKHTVGPFKTPPFSDFVCSSLGVRPKKLGGVRLIMDLSRPFKLSVNDFISKDDYTLNFCSVDDAIAICLKLGPGCLMAKTDLKGAFRLIPVAKQDWPLLGYKCDEDYYFDTVLPFGCRSSPSLFDDLSKVLEWKIKTSGGMPDILHYIDDFWWAAAKVSNACAVTLAYVRALCNDLGVPLAEEKTEGPTTNITFLGVQLDTVSQTISIPEAKVKEIHDLFVVYMARRRATKREILSICGQLGFATKCIPAGRVFLRRMLTLAHKVRGLDFKVKLTQGFRADLQWWIDYLPRWNGTCNFLQTDWTASPAMHLFTDASGSVGCGGVYDTQWFQLAWPQWLLDTKPSIALLELLPVLISCVVWGKNWQSKRILFHCDNMTVVSLWSKMSTPNIGIMTVIRRMLFTAAQGNFTLRVSHISGVNNDLADALSRFDNGRFFALHPMAERHSVNVTETIDFLREIVAQPGHCSSSMQEPGILSAEDWLPLPEEAIEMGSTDFGSFV